MDKIFTPVKTLIFGIILLVISIMFLIYKVIPAWSNFSDQWLSATCFSWLLIASAIAIVKIIEFPLKDFEFRINTLLLLLFFGGACLLFFIEWYIVATFFLIDGIYLVIILRVAMKTPEQSF